ncbi:hypothetical protein KSP40_PGU017847 [Platanthera guangdongensis]|uniref:Uncharacterized protein n=1 Tax=Platanthera guangdongensis TaxID=2320717 RepID=A0ABR2N3P4_9ASPA
MIKASFFVFFQQTGKIIDQTKLGEKTFVASEEMQIPTTVRGHSERRQKKGSARRRHATRYLANQEWVRNDSLKTIENTAIPVIMLVAEVPCDITFSHGTSSLVDISKAKSSKLSGEHDNVSLLNLSGLQSVITSRISMIPKNDADVVSKSVRLDISFKSTSHTGLQTSELVTTIFI